MEFWNADDQIRFLFIHCLLINIGVCFSFLAHYCNNCGRVYRYYRSLWRHLKFECGKLPSFGCPQSDCYYKAKQKSSLINHVCNKHPILAAEMFKQKS